MSIQFRSRISGQYNPPTVIGPLSSGYCCGLNQATTRAVCDAANGHFISGAFNGTDCPSTGMCMVGLVGELPGACCYWTKTNGLYTQGCTAVNSQLECINANQGAAENLGYSFYSGETCIFDGGNIQCNSVNISASDVSDNCNPNDYTNCYNSNNSVGNCCTQNSDGTIDCSIKSKKNCFGYWSAPNRIIQSCLDLNPCSGVYFAGLSGAETPARASLTRITSSTNPIETLPAIGSLYQGGLYVGVFRPGSPINSTGSTVYGNRITGTAGNYTARGNSPGTKEKSWILIASVSDFTDFPYNVENEPTSTLTTSSYDGLYNTYNTTISENNTLLSQVKQYKINGFSDWYLPSQDELALYFKNISFGYETSGFFGLTKEQYMTSTVFSLNGVQEFDGKTFVVAQMANTQENYGKTNMVYRGKTIGVRLFRRIYLDS
jgi:hypothetical protein